MTVSDMIFIMLNKKNGKIIYIKASEIIVVEESPYEGSYVYLKNGQTEHVEEKASEILVKMSKR